MYFVASVISTNMFVTVFRIFYLICLVSQNCFPIPKTFTSGNCLPKSSSLFSLYKKHVLCQPHPNPCLYMSLVHSHQQVWWLFQTELNYAIRQKKSKHLKIILIIFMSSWGRDLSGLLRTSAHF